MHQVLNLVLNDLLMNFPAPPECGLLEAGIVEHLMGPGSLLGTRDTELRQSQQSSSRFGWNWPDPKGCMLMLSMSIITPQNQASEVEQGLLLMQRRACHVAGALQMLKWIKIISFVLILYSFNCIYNFMSLSFYLTLNNFPIFVT